MKTFFIGIIFFINLLLAKNYLVEVEDDFLPRKSSDYNVGASNQKCKVENCQLEVSNCHHGKRKKKNCSGLYEIQKEERVPWAPHRPVYKLKNKNLYIFWDKGTDWST